MVELSEKIKKINKKLNEIKKIEKSNITNMAHMQSFLYSAVYQAKDELSKQIDMLNTHTEYLIRKDTISDIVNNDNSDLKYLFAIKNITENKIIFNARGGVYKEYEKAVYKLNELKKSSEDEFEIIVWKFYGEL